MGPWQIIASIVSIILFVSMPSVALTWFKLRRRDIGAILNASGWAINKQMRFSMALGRMFTKCARTSVWWLFVLAFVILASLATYTAWYFISSGSCSADEVEAQECYVEGDASEAALTSETKGE
jgi:ABC-type multidrug transport system fused ATPase/permease subunit